MIYIEHGAVCSILFEKVYVTVYTCIIEAKLISMLLFYFNIVGVYGFTDLCKFYVFELLIIKF